MSKRFRRLRDQTVDHPICHRWSGDLLVAGDALVAAGAKDDEVIDGRAVAEALKPETDDVGRAALDEIVKRYESGGALSVGFHRQLRAMAR